MDASIIDLWPSAEQFAADIGLKYPSHARVMKVRGRIPPAYEQRIIAAASARGIELPAQPLKGAA
jgi:hypothetical protein